MTTTPPGACPVDRAAAYCAAPRASQEPPLFSFPDKPQALPPDMDHVPRGIQWVRIIGAVALLAVFAGGYVLNEWRKTNALRTQILKAHDRASTAFRAPVQRLDRKLADLVTAAAARPWTGDYRDPIFRVDALGKGRGIYVRVPRVAARDRDALHQAARRQHTDAVAGCLAVNPALYGRLLVLGDLVGRDFRDKIVNADGVTRLRALDQDFVLRAQRDLPRLADILRPDWLIAILEGGAAPTEVHVWDLHRGRELLRLRPDLTAGVVNVQWSGRGAVPSTAATDPTVLNTVQDCAIAQAIRERSGETLTTIGLPPAAP